MEPVVLPVPYFPQLRDTYCGGASAQMVLTYLGLSNLDQVALYREAFGNHQTEEGWFSPPDGLTAVLNKHRPADTPPFRLVVRSTRDEISAAIVWSLYRYKTPTPLIVLGTQHWIVATGYQITAAPSSDSYSGYTIETMFFNNPWTASGHFPGANQHATYAQWKSSSFLTGAINSAHWKDKFLAICPDFTAAPSHRAAALATKAR